jgi:hypothetical protein
MCPEPCRRAPGYQRFDKLSAQQQLSAQQELSAYVIDREVAQETLRRQRH